MTNTKHLRCEYLVNPLAIEATQPRMSWIMETSRKGARQVAYRILASDCSKLLSRDIGNLWDSEKVFSDQSLHVKYQGRPLKSYQQVFWKVKVWDEGNKEGPWSKVATFTMGILKRKLWQGQFIGHYLGQTKSCPLLRKEFSTKSKVKRALIHVTARGLYHLTLNGKKVTEDLLAPGWTDFDKRMHYRCYDLTQSIQETKHHCISAELGHGWYKSRIIEDHQGRSYGQRVGLLAQIRVEYENGKVDTIKTDESWKTIFGPTRQSDLYDGEFYDAQLEPKGWDQVRFDDSHWENVFVHKKELLPSTLLEPYPAEPVRVTQELRPVKFWNIAPGKTIYDFGQNFAGHIRLHFRGKAGCVVHMRFGEMINLDNSLYVDNMRSAFASDTYIMLGKKKEVWEPKFTYHGFRYVEISGCPVSPSLENVTGVVVGSDTTQVGTFHCSDQLVNQIYSNALWTQQANFLEVPTDCPQRDERLGWTGDAQVFIRTAICNMDVAAFFTKWTRDLLDGQVKNGAFPNIAPNILAHLLSGDAAWGDAGVVCPWTLYQCYEDRDLLLAMYPSMKRWVAYLKKTSTDDLRNQTHCFGDHLSINADTPKEVIQTAHFAYAVDITRKSAEVLGKNKDADKYHELFHSIKKSFNQAYVKKDGKILGNTQTAYLMALKFGLLSPKNETLATKHLVADIKKRKNHLSTGFIGTSMILSVLRDKGQLELAYQLLMKTTFPSWGYSVVNGATTIWERWNSWTKEKGPGDVSMNSYSHYAYGAVVEWMYDTIAGIDHCGHGFQHFSLRPRPGGDLKYAEATFHSPYGLIRSSWKLRKNKYLYKITIPPNTKATVSLPTQEISKVKMDDEYLTKKHQKLVSKDGIVVDSGEYTFTWPA